ncbi:MAG: TIGR00282 family metallophosphoesterase [Clostridia bacterium]|nr:TIGR00282 family metallophosphoesterase [Clostridia bacterium]
MKILAVGDIVGEAGVEELGKRLPKIKEGNNIDFVIVNGENAAGGMGINEKNYKGILKAGADVVTLGNHTWAKKDVFSFINDSKILRPANYSKGLPGKGYGIYECGEKKIAVINLIGRVDMNVLSENPFQVAKKIILKIKNEVDMIIVDFHAEATAEKIAMSRYLDGYVTVLFGTHTHVQTADEKILPKGTGYITDIGMTGPENSVIGMDIEASIKRFETTLPERYKIASGSCILNGCIFEVDENDFKVTNITRI